MPRNSSGTYTLPAGNPVAPNTIIQTAWANPTMSDIGSALTDSLDRFGRGSMLAPIKAPDGAVNAPVYTFVSEASLGLYRPSPGVLGVAVGGAQVASFSSAGVNIINLTGTNLDLSGKLSVGGLSQVATSRSWFQADFASGITGAIHTATYGGSNSIQGRSYGGTIAAPTATAANASLINIVGGGTHDGVTFFNTASVQLLAEVVPTVGSQPTKISFQTTAAGSTSRAERASLDSLGRFNVNGPSILPVVGVDVNGAIRAYGSSFFQSSISGVVQGVSGAGGHQVITASGAPADQKMYDTLLDTSGTLSFRAVNDAGSNATTWMQAVRSGFTVSSVGISVSTAIGFGVAGAQRMSIDNVGRVVVGPGLASMPTLGLDSVGVVRARGAFNPTVATTSAELGTIAGFPASFLTASGAAVDNRIWTNYADSTGAMYFIAHNDAISVGQPWLSVVRSGTTISSVNFPQGAITTAGSLDVGGYVRAKGAMVYNPAVSGVAIGTNSGIATQNWVTAGAPVDSKIYDVFVDTAGSMQWRLLNDAVNNAASWLLVSRTGLTVNNLQMGGPIGFGAAPAAGFTIDMQGAGGAGGGLGGVNNIGGSSNTGAYSIWAGRSTLNGAYIQLFGASNATNPNTLIFGTASTSRLVLDATGTVNVVAGSGALRVGGLITRFVSAEQACPTANSQTAVAHGGSRTPDLFTAVLRCVIADNGYAAGHEVIASNDASDTTRQYSIVANATSISLLYVPNPPTGTAPALRNLATGVFTVLTPGSWRVVLKGHWL